MIAHLTSRHPSSDARIYKRSVTTLRSNGWKVKYYTKDDGLITSTEDDVTFRPRKGRLGDIAMTIAMMLKASRSKDVKIIHFHDPEFMPFTWIAKLYGKKVVYDIHENFYVKFQNKGAVASKLLSGFYSLFEKFSFLFIDGAIAVSQGLMEMYLSKVKHHEVIRNVPLKSSFASLDEVMNDKYLIYISGINSEKRNCSSIVAALPIVLKEFPKVRVQFVGRYEPSGYLDELRKMATELGVEDHVSFEPMLAYQENFRRASVSGLGLVLYEDNINNRIGIPNRLFEYMAVGLPVVAEQFGELRRVIDTYENGVLVDSSTGEGLARGIIDVYSDEERYSTMGKNSKQAILGDLNFESEVKRIERLYRNLSSGELR